MGEPKLPKLPAGVPEAFMALVEEVVSFHPAIAKLCGGAQAGLMCCQGMYWSRMKHIQANKGWFYKSAKEWEEETCLTRREQDTAKKVLKKKGFMETKLAKVNGVPTLHFRMNFMAILEAHIEQTRCTEPPNPLHENAKPENTDPPNGNPQNANPLGCTEPPNGVHKNANSYKEQESSSGDFQETSRGERKRPVRPVFSQSERDTMDWKRIAPWFTDKLAPQPGTHIADRNRELTDRAIQSAMNGGVSKVRAQELFRQWYPGEAWVEDITRQLPLIEGETA